MGSSTNLDSLGCPTISMLGRDPWETLHLASLETGGRVYYEEAAALFQGSDALIPDGNLVRLPGLR